MKSNSFTLRELTEIHQVMEVGRKFVNAAGNEHRAKQYLEKGKLFVAEEISKINRLLDDHSGDKFLIWVVGNYLMGGYYFSGHRMALPSIEEAKEITQTMLDSSLIEPNEISQSYLDGTFTNKKSA